jgi:hypothetical protein
MTEQVKMYPNKKNSKQSDWKVKNILKKMTNKDNKKFENNSR